MITFVTPEPTAEQLKLIKRLHEFGDIIDEDGRRSFPPKTIQKAEEIILENPYDLDFIKAHLSFLENEDKTIYYPVISYEDTESPYIEIAILEEEIRRTVVEKY